MVRCVLRKQTGPATLHLVFCKFLSAQSVFSGSCQDRLPNKRRLLNHFRLGLFITSVWLAIAPANAAPPASCASKFVGSWIVRVNATGQTYPAEVYANGRGHVTCPMCTPGGSWTCSGNTYFYTVDNGVSGQATLSADGRTTVGACCTSTRVGPVPRMAAAAPVEQAKVAAPEKPVGRQRQSCSDITGTGGGSPAPSNCGTNGGGLPCGRQSSARAKLASSTSHDPGRMAAFRRMIRHRFWHLAIC